MTDDQVHEAVVRWIAGIVGLKVIKAHQSGHRPQLPYVVIDLVAVAPVRLHSTAIEHVNTGQQTPEGKDEVQASPVMHTEWRFMVQAHGPVPTQLLRPIRSAVEIGQEAEALIPLSIQEVGRVNDVPEWVKNAWEPRASMDLFVHGYTRDGFVVDVSEEIPTPTITNIN